MLEKILVPIIALIGQFIIAWYGYFNSKLPNKGSYLGFNYDSIFIRSIITQFEYFWVLILINIFFGLAFHLGLDNYKNYIVVVMIWIASGPISALIFNAIFVKEKLDPPLILGIILVGVGAIAVVAHKEIAGLFSIQA